MTISAVPGAVAAVLDPSDPSAASGSSAASSGSSAVAGGPGAVAVAPRGTDHAVVDSVAVAVGPRAGAVGSGVVDQAAVEFCAGAPGSVEISVIMPCLDEEASVGICVARAFAGIADTGLTGEVIVVDNGSTDTSIPVARAAGARVLTESRQGYGNTCLAGFAATRGRYLVMGGRRQLVRFS
ncbi:glycosyltransferase [Protofrankia coriariae]|uniref:glycosyltransferase n=1 Tax=Protofrankia coriariae TaxID=1562887 RepID=UPI001F2BED1A|nr:glycosyltransferase [Protofrankia coriariae]